MTVMVCSPSPHPPLKLCPRSESPKNVNMLGDLAKYAVHGFSQPRMMLILFTSLMKSSWFLRASYLFTASSEDGDWLHRWDVGDLGFSRPSSYQVFSRSLQICYFSILLTGYCHVITALILLYHIQRGTYGGSIAYIIVFVA